MSRHEVYYQPKVVPCACGSHEPYWHGPEAGTRIYCCDACWQQLQAKRKTSNVGICGNCGERVNFDEHDRDACARRKEERP